MPNDSLGSPSADPYNLHILNERQKANSLPMLHQVFDRNTLRGANENLSFTEAIDSPRTVSKHSEFNF